MPLPLKSPVTIALLVKQILKLGRNFFGNLILSLSLDHRLHLFHWVYSGDSSLAKTLKSKSGLFSVNYFLEEPQSQPGYTDTIWNKGKPTTGWEEDRLEFESLFNHLSAHKYDNRLVVIRGEGSEGKQSG